MTILVHFRGPRAAVRLYNVSTVEDDGPRKVKTTSIFSDTASHFDDVRRVVVEPEEPDDDLLTEDEADKADRAKALDALRGEEDR